MPWSTQTTDILSGPPNFTNDALFQMNCTNRGHHAGVKHLTNSIPASSSPDCDVTSHVGLKYLKQQFGVRNKSRRCDFWFAWRPSWLVSTLWTRLTRTGSRAFSPFIFDHIRRYVIFQIQLFFKIFFIFDHIHCSMFISIEDILTETRSETSILRIKCIGEKYLEGQLWSEVGRLYSSPLKRPFLTPH